MKTIASLLLLLPFSSLAWISSPPPTSRTPTRLHLKNIFQTDGLPKDVKDAVRRCKDATQEALKARISRMDVEFPVGTKFGVEKTKSKSRDGTPTKDDLDRSDRELARLYVDMFQPVGGENIAVIFPDQTRADLAKKQWDTTAQCRILSIDKKKVKQKASKGFAAKMEQEFDNDESGPFKLPENIEVALFVAPTKAKDLIAVERVAREVGMSTLVVLLNARLSKIDRFASADAEELFKSFEPVFHLAAADQQSAPNCLLYRAYPSKWTLARKPKVGQPKPVLESEVRPNNDSCKVAFDQLELSDIEKGVENVLDNVADWFR